MHKENTRLLYRPSKILLVQVGTLSSSHPSFGFFFLFHNAAGARGTWKLWVALRRPASSSSTCSPRKRRVAPTRTGRCTGRRRRAPPPSSSTTRSRSPWRRWRATPKKHQQAGAQDAHQLGRKKSLSLSPNWVTNKQTADGLLRTAAVEAPVPPSSADGPLHPSRTDHVVPTIAVVGSLVM